jgi:hypothetical protein
MPEAYLRRQRRASPFAFSSSTNTTGCDLAVHYWSKGGRPWKKGRPDPLPGLLSPKFLPNISIDAV